VWTTKERQPDATLREVPFSLEKPCCDIHGGDQYGMAEKGVDRNKEEVGFGISSWRGYFISQQRSC